MNIKRFFCMAVIGGMLLSQLSMFAGAVQIEEVFPKENVQITYEDAKRPNEAPIQPYATKTKLFSFTLTNVSDIVATYTNKMVARKNITNGYLRMEGTITNSSNSKPVRIGLCVTNASGNYVNKLSVDTFATNEWDYVTWPKSKVPTSACRAFVKNISTKGWLNGDVYVYNSDI